MEGLRERVFATISKVMNVPVASLTEESSPDTVPSWESITHINLILALEDEFGVSFTDEQMVEMLNVRLILMVLEGALG